MIYILFGEMGVGKNYVGERLAQGMGCEFFDGDTVIPKPMQDKIDGFEILTASVVEDFIHNHLIPEIQKRKTDRRNLVVAQALYRKEYRQAVIDVLGEENVKVIYLPAPSFFTHMKRLMRRKNGIRWVIFCLISKLFFQRPYQNTTVIINEDDSKLNYEKIISGE
jgi:gluconate kinase